MWLDQAATCVARVACVGCVAGTKKAAAYLSSPIPSANGVQAAHRWFNHRLFCRR